MHDLSGIVFTRIHTCESSQSLTMSKAADIPDLRNELGTKAGADAVHGAYRIIFRKCGCEFVHLLTELLNVL